jgi:hypothetical protein
MASELKVDKLNPSSGTDLTLGDASDTVIVPTGATLNIVDGIGVAAGGTGLSSFTAGDVLYATGTTTLAKLAKGTAEQVLAMNSGATAPDWGSVDLTVLPTITVGKGGTNLTSFTAGDIFYATGTTTITKLGKGTGLQGLQTNSGATAPEWANSPQSLMTAAGDVLYASGANTLAKLAKGSNDEVLTLAGGVPSWAAATAGGKLYAQPLQATDSTMRSTTSTSSWEDCSNTMSQAITMSASDSKVLVTATFTSQSGSTDSAGSIFRDSTNLGDSVWGMGRTYGANNYGTYGFIYLDAPGDTSEHTYTSQIYTASGGTTYMNRYGIQGQITVMEVLA